jgi:protein-S-isoprenylcysteine O-methyltransferase Ste14
MRKIIETIFATILVPGAAVILIPYLLYSGSGMHWPARIGFLHGLSILGGLTGLGMIVWVSIVFVIRGGGTPIPLDPPSRFVASGLFRYVRNPMYVGATLVLACEAVFFLSPILAFYTFVLWFALHIFLVVIEEPQLERRFGESYRIYLNTTPRWIPRLAVRDRHKS